MNANPQLAVSVQTGLVRWFDRRLDKRFGFITLDWKNPKEEDIFFHLNDNAIVYGDAGQPYFRTDPANKPARLPEEGDLVVFETQHPPRGPKAKPWAYLHDYEAIVRGISPQPLYRLVGHYHISDGGKEKKGPRIIFWGGLSLDSLYLRYPDCRADLAAIKWCFRLPCSKVEGIHLEVLPAEADKYDDSAWMPYEIPEDADDDVVLITEPKLKITAEYGHGGHETEYVIRLWEEEPGHPGHYLKCLDFPKEFSDEFEIVARAEPKRWAVYPRGVRIEVYFTDQLRTEEPVPYGTPGFVSFSSNHFECKRLIETTLQRLKTKLAKLRKEKILDIWADDLTSPLIKERKLTFHVNEVVVE